MSPRGIKKTPAKPVRKVSEPMTNTDNAVSAAPALERPVNVETTAPPLADNAVSAAPALELADELNIGQMDFDKMLIVHPLAHIMRSGQGDGERGEYEGMKYVAVPRGAKLSDGRKIIENDHILSSNDKGELLFGNMLIMVCSKKAWEKSLKQDAEKIERDNRNGPGESGETTKHTISVKHVD